MNFYRCVETLAKINKNMLDQYIEKINVDDINIFLSPEYDKSIRKIQEKHQYIKTRDCAEVEWFFSVEDLMKLFTSKESWQTIYEQIVEEYKLYHEEKMNYIYITTKNEDGKVIEEPYVCFDGIIKLLLCLSGFTIPREFGNRISRLISREIEMISYRDEDSIYVTKKQCEFYEDIIRSEKDKGHPFKRENEGN